ncbi:hypothetical protein ACFLS0_06675 [Candidatus Bipolaricaulota bacterium]
MHGRLSSSPKQEVMMGDRYIPDALGDNRLSIHTPSLFAGLPLNAKKETAPPNGEAVGFLAWTSESY